MAGRIRRLSPAMIVACIALAVALGGVGYAATVLPANSVGALQLKANAVNSSKVLNGSLLKADTRESTTITLRFDPRLLARIKRIARSRYLNYQSMIKQWLSERIEKEM